MNFDYVHISLQVGYESTPDDDSVSVPLAKLFKEAIGSETALITISQIVIWLRRKRH